MFISKCTEEHDDIQCGKCHRVEKNFKPTFDPIAFAEWVKEEIRIAKPNIRENEFAHGSWDTLTHILSYLASHGITTKE